MIDELRLPLFAVPGTVIDPVDGFGVLRPFDKREAMTTKEAAIQAGVTSRQVRRWVDRYGIGRKVGGELKVSRVALLMFLDNDGRALNKYRDGDRGRYVVPYFVRLGLAETLISAPCATNGDIGDIFKSSAPCVSDGAL